MLLSDGIFINQLACKVKPIHCGRKWFSQKGNKSKKDIINAICYFIKQSGAINSDAENAIADSGLKPTYTPCILLSMANSNKELGNHILFQVLKRISDLPETESEKVFLLLISLLGIGLQRKKAKIEQPSRLWWLRDLGDETVVKDVI